MKYMRIIILTLLTVFAFSNASAKTVSWVISPKYDKLSRYSSDIFVFQQDGKWGLIKLGNQEILPAIFEYITPFVNGYALAGTKEGNRYILERIISENGEVTTIGAKYYLPTNYQYFSEGKLVVANQSGKYGYINPSGQITVKCQFDNALPFKDNWAPVKQGNYFRYINESYDRNQARSVLVVDFHYGEMTLASCFSNGKAAIAYNKDFALIGTNGKKVKKLNETEFKRTYKNNNLAPEENGACNLSKTYTEFSENGLVGLKLKDELIVKPQFSSFLAQFSDGYFIADKDGKQGLLSVSDGNYLFDIKSLSGSKSELEVDRSGNIEKIVMNVSAPVSNNHLKLMADCGDGQMQDITSQMTVNGLNASVSVSPLPMAKAETCTVKAVLENDGIIVAEANNSFTLSYPIKLRVSSPKAVSSKADENDNVTIYSVIYNDSNKEVTVKITLNAKQTVSKLYTIRPHSSIQISVTEKITIAQTINTSVSLSTGERANSSLYLEPFF